MDQTEKSMNLRNAGIVLSWLSSILTALISSWAGTWVKMLFEELLGEDAPLPNLTEWFLASAHAFWIVPVGVGIALFITRKYRYVQDGIVLLSPVPVGREE
ncbi:MAG: hypothetical protein V8T90_05005 [Victivallales bacterium]